MATLGSMIVNVLANTAGFAKGMKGVRDELSDVEKFSANAKTALAGIVGGVSAAALAHEFKQVADQIADTARMAQQLGISTKAFGGLAYGARMAGVETGTFADAMKTLSEKTSEAAMGGGEAAEAFKALGLNAKSLNSMGVDKSLQHIANKMQFVENANDRLRIGIQLFGDEGSRLVNVLGKGEGELSKFRRQAEALGIVYGADEVSKVESFNQAWVRLSETLGGIKTDIVIRFADDASATLEALADTVAAAGAIVDAKPKTTSGKLKQWFAGLPAKIYDPFYTPIHNMAQNSLLDMSVWTDAPKFSEREVGKQTLERIDAMTGVVGKSLVTSFLGARGWRAPIGGTQDNAYSALLGKQAEQRVGAGATYLVNRIAGAGSSATVRGLQAFADGIEQAKSFGNSWLLSNAFSTGKRTTAGDQWFADRRTADQMAGLKFISDKLGLTRGFRELQKAFASPGANADQFRGVNSPLIKGTMEAARAELAHLNKRDNQAMLNENKKHTGLLTKLVEQMRVNVTGL